MQFFILKSHNRASNIWPYGDYLLGKAIRLANYNAKHSRASDSDAVIIIGFYRGCNYSFSRVAELQSCKQYFAGLGKFLIIFKLQSSALYSSY